jgi:DNA-binding MarR family transcriptional regulator
MSPTATDDALLALARLAMDASIRAAGELGGISPVQLRALTALRHRGRLNLAQLAEEMGITVSTASRLVDRLAGAEWVRRAPSTRDRREISLTLTADGTTLLRRFDDRRVALLRSCLDRVPAERRDDVVTALAELAVPAARTLSGSDADWR